MSLRISGFINLYSLDSFIAFKQISRILYNSDLENYDLFWHYSAYDPIKLSKEHFKRLSQQAQFLNITLPETYPSPPDSGTEQSLLPYALLRIAHYYGKQQEVLEQLFHDALINQEPIHSVSYLGQLAFTYNLPFSFEHNNPMLENLLLKLDRDKILYRQFDFLSPPPVFIFNESFAMLGELDLPLIADFIALYTNEQSDDEHTWVSLQDLQRLQKQEKHIDSSKVLCLERLLAKES